MSPQPVTVTGTGMVNGVGLSEPSACAAIAASINNFQETKFMDARGHWVVASQTPLPNTELGIERIARMLAITVAQTFEREAALVPSEVPIIACLSERERPDRDAELSGRVMARLQEMLGFPFHAESTTVSQGRVGGVVALREARRMLYEHKARAVIVAGADSYLSAKVLHHYGGARRLLTESNSDGFVPGEGAAAILLQLPTPSPEPRPILVGIGFGVEKSTIDSDAPLRADGLCQAIRDALADASMSMGDIDFRITDSSGEQYWFKEAALALTRLLRERKEEFDYWHTADCIGEVGAACGPSILCYAGSAFDNGFAKGDNLICHFGNDDGKRAAAVMTYQPVISRGQ